MKFSLENSAGYSIRSYQAGQVEVVSIAHAQSDQPGAESITLSSSVIITPDRLVENWPPSSSAVLAMEHLDMVLATAPEVIILGTGSRLVFPDQKIPACCPCQE